MIGVEGAGLFLFLVTHWLTKHPLSSFVSTDYNFAALKQIIKSVKSVLLVSLGYFKFNILG